ncbi:MAG TPA: hypothetical protein EYO34_03465 [Candidatus Marinimicrobia bacterium]|nr:hypothetical protein [Candidatus Neomarinimicrobiota bacterium]HIB70586.1 hypothetical protein [Candidatus Neomarinimicrobiota bacterium]HIB94973.1 hypothetical protein [Candidatus Neomarinimicrobiota bacterium]HIN62553.1 hypothetical protein [Candidatus Neomarinimicrobiota bacterium]HIO75418.1 hypothetical protein [Candidatus Neomarinimicrobiota bacterium]
MPDNLNPLADFISYRLSNRNIDWYPRQDSNLWPFA